MGYKFYYIRTHHTLDWVEQTLYRVGYATTQNQLRVIKDRVGRETNGTLAFLDETVYFKLIQEQRADLRIEPFEVPRVFHPNPDKYTYNFCIPFPRQGHLPPGFHGARASTTDRDRFYVQQIEMRLSPFIAHGLVPPDAYAITVPVVSRERSETKAIAFVAFHPSISRDTLAAMRYLLDTAVWPHDPASPFKCFWARVPPS